MARTPTPRGFKAREDKLRRHLAKVLDGLDQACNSAQVIAFDAAEAPEAEHPALAIKALGVSPLAADAWALLAEQVPPESPLHIALLRQAVAAGQLLAGTMALVGGDAVYWEATETRPYLRARQQLALALWHCDQREEAIAEAEALLRLNPEDNQGIRYLLADWLLAVGGDARLKVLLETYAEDGSPSMAYAAVLLALRQGDEAAARAALTEAQACNPHVPGMLLGTVPLPENETPYVTPGEPDEAADYVMQAETAWRETPGALEWLRGVVG